MENKRPNLLLFVSDHFRSEAVHHLGNEASVTPNIDALVSDDAVSFSNAFCQNPVCVPSRCSFLSGNYPHVNGFRTMHHLMSAQDDNLLKELKKNGYHVYFGGKNDVFKEEVDLSLYCDDRSDAYSELGCIAQGVPMKKGYRPILQGVTQQMAIEAANAKEASRHTQNGKNYYSFYQGIVDDTNPFAIGFMGAEDAQIKDAIHYLENYDGDAPLCMYLSLTLPHPFYACTKEDAAVIDQEKLSPMVTLTPSQVALKPSIMQGMRENYQLYHWSKEELLAIKKTYLAMVHHVDENFGKVIEAFRQKQVYDDTAVFLFSDHGDYAGDYGIAEINQNTFEDVLTKVPLVIKPPKSMKVRPGIRSALVELIDIPQTISEIAIMPLSYPQFGRSLCSQFMTIKEHRRYVHCEGGRREDETHCMDGGHPKEHLYWPRTSEQMKMPQHTKAVMIRSQHYKYVKRLYELDEFYDLTRDPLELNNRIQEEQYQEIISEMKEELLNFMIKTCDQVPYHRDER